MSIKEQFSPTEWQSLQITIAEVTNAVMLVQPGGEAAEGAAIFTIQEEVLDEFRESQLVHLLFVQDATEASALQAYLADRGKRSGAAARVDALYACRHAVALLREKGMSDKDITAYRSVAFAMADKMAHAAKEGGFLGIGGERVTDAERTLLDELKQALA